MHQRVDAGVVLGCPTVLLPHAASVGSLHVPVPQQRLFAFLDADSSGDLSSTEFSQGLLAAGDDWFGALLSLANGSRDQHLHQANLTAFFVDAGRA